ncbi:ABC transporter permease [Cohnella soli]|uniref:ABC transporter permease n=1 Tax=Cohnella soli TaxID=425005 RepID=A0ABW0HLD6_9BACL
MKKIPLPNGTGLFVLYLALIIFFGMSSPYFFTTGNFINILNNASVLGIIAIAMTFVIISGGIDLSVASVVALTGVSTVQIYGHGAPVWLAVSCGMMIGIAAGLINGFLITKLKINSLITTLGTMSIFRGLAFVLSGGLTNSMPDAGFGQLGRGRVEIFSLSVPYPLIILLLLFIFAYIVLKYSIFGRMVYSIGGNPEASRLAGIKVVNLQMRIYVLAGVFSSFAGLVLTSQLAAGAPQAATGIELSVIAAVILGGCSLVGGKGTMVGTFLGVLILGTVNNGLTIMNVSSYWQDVARGTVLLIAVGADQFRFGGLTKMFRRFSSPRSASGLQERAS